MSPITRKIIFIFIYYYVIKVMPITVHSLGHIRLIIKIDNNVFSLWKSILCTWHMRPLSLTSGSYRYEVHLSGIEMAYTPGAQMIFFLNLVWIDVPLTWYNAPIIIKNLTYLKANKFFINSNGTLHL